MIDRWKKLVFLLQLALLPNILGKAASLSTVDQLAGWNCDTRDECNGGAGCIPAEWKCNGLDNCPNGSDELSCINGFTCSNSNRSIPQEWVCNGYANCDDSADETSCSCPEFTCSSGFCIDNDKKCDKINDCGDWSDELSTCDCPTIEFTCVSGYKNFSDKCVPAEKVCDGMDDCKEDRSDEAPCNATCIANEYRCPNNVSNFEFSPCIDNSYVCDGYADCVDHSDETGSCPGCSERCLSRTQTYNGYLLIYICIDLKICDGYVDCLDGSDEKVARCGCSNGIECSLSDRCLPMTDECDGNNQCGDAKDWTDECYCGYGNYQVQNCSNSGRCLAPWQLCDGVDDCGDGSDETSCPSVVTDCEYFSEPKYPCHNFTGKDDRCIDIDHVCDGYGDCSDSSDETICNAPCTNGKLRCATGVSNLPGKPICIDESLWCDGTAQCYDHSDEHYFICKGVCEEEDSIEPRRCKSAADDDTYICINSTNRFDRTIDCAQQEDEHTCCASNKLACLLDAEYIEDENICDQMVNCTRKNETQCPVCYSSSYMCTNTRCINSTSFCDGTNDCGDNSDEPPDCPTQLPACTADQHSCTNGECINMELECDGVDHCGDGSDEQNCPIQMKIVIALAVTGAVLGLTLLVVIVWFALLNQRRQRRKEEKNHSDGTSTLKKKWVAVSIAGAVVAPVAAAIIFGEAAVRKLKSEDNEGNQETIGHEIVEGVEDTITILLTRSYSRVRHDPATTKQSTEDIQSSREKSSNDRDAKGPQ